VTGELIQTTEGLEITVHNLAFDFHCYIDAVPFGFHTPMIIPIRMQPSSG
jgi:hypothetical protein